MVGDKFVVSAGEVLVKAFTSPNKSECFFLCLATAMFDGGQRTVGVADWSECCPVFLHNDGTKSDWTCICDDLRA